MASPLTNPFLHDHPVSSYAQKVRLALREKNIPFDFETPQGFGSGQRPKGLSEANPRLEVPALLDGDVKLFDSTVILQYLEDKWPESALLPKDPAQKAKVRMLEDVCDTHYEAINWAYGEINLFNRATGELREKLIKQIEGQTDTIISYLAKQLGSKPYFNGDDFGYGDICVAPMYNRSVAYGLGAPAGSPLAEWHKRIREREHVKTTFAEMEQGIEKMKGLGKVFREQNFKREYRDHRLEWMVKSGKLMPVFVVTGM